MEKTEKEIIKEEVKRLTEEGIKVIDIELAEEWERYIGIHSATMKSLQEVQEALIIMQSIDQGLEIKTIIEQSMISENDGGIEISLPTSMAINYFYKESDKFREEWNKQKDVALTKPEKGKYTDIEEISIDFGDTFSR